MTAMHPTENCFQIIKEFEGLRLNAYKCPVGVWTIGWGHTKGVAKGMTCTKEQAEEWLRSDVAAVAREVGVLVSVPLYPSMTDALVSFVFNLRNGVEQFRNSTMRRLLNYGAYEDAAAQFPRWVYGTVNGRKEKLPGLIRRRNAEKALFLRDYYFNTSTSPQ